MRIAVTGANGLMGTELAKILDYVPVTRANCDIRDGNTTYDTLRGINPDLIVHLAAFVDVVGAEANKQLAYDTNVIGTRNVAWCARDLEAKLLYVSTDYIFDGTKGWYRETDYPNPLQFYGLSKLLGEYEARMSGVAKIARMSFKPRPYKHARVPVEMRFSGGYVDDMAKELKFAIEHYNCLPEIINIGIGDIYLIDLARETREVEPMSINDIPVRIPRDTTLNLSTWNHIRRERG